MPAADVNQTYATKMSQLKQRRALSSGRSDTSSYSADSLNLNNPPDSASSRASTLRSEAGDDMGLSLAPKQNNNQDETSVMQMAAVEEQLRSIADENGRLMKLVAEKDYEIKKLKKKALLAGQVPDATSELISANSITGDVTASKIIELSKKIREVTSELHKEQNKSKQYSKQISEKEDEIRVLHSELSSVSTLKMASAVASAKKRGASGGGAKGGGGARVQMTEEEVTQLKDRLDSTTAKMLEYRAQMETVKMELKKTQKALQSEVGEGVSVHDIISGNKSGSGATWRGRQQKIIELQQKLQEYKEFAANSGLSSISNNQSNTSNVTSRTNDTLEDEMMFANPTSINLNNSNSHVNANNERNKAHIKVIEKKRQEEIDDLRTQVKNFESENTRLQQNLDSSKARNKTLSNETKTLKNQIGLLKEKSQHDDELVTALMGQIDVLKEDLKRAIEAEKEASQFAPGGKLTAAQEQVEKAIVDQLKHLVAEKESKIQELEMRLLTIHMGQNQQSQSFANNFELESVNSRNTSARSDVGNVPIQISKNASLTSISSQARPGSSRRPESALNGAHNTELEHKLQEVSTLLSAASVEKEKLREFCALLQKRVDESVEYKMKLEKELSHHKKRSVMLEKQVGAASVSTNNSVSLSTSGLPPTGNSKSRGLAGSMAHMNASSVSLRDSNANGASAPANDNLSSKCELLQEEIVSLKFNLQTIMKARDEDFALYKNMIEETKNVFLTALRQLKQPSSRNEDPTIVNLT